MRISPTGNSLRLAEIGPNGTTHRTSCHSAFGVAGDGIVVGRCAERGFTLVELLIVLVVIGVMAALAVSNFSHFVSQSQEKHVLDDTVRELNRLRNKAILGRRLLRADLRFGSGEIVQIERAGNTTLVALPKDFSFEKSVQRTDLNPTSDAVAEGDELSILFHPDGSANEVRFDLLTPHGRRYAVRISGLTGRIESSQEAERQGATPS